jgi:hypothetical protein
MSKAIQTKRLPTTHTKPARIKAEAEGVSHKVFSVSSLEDELENRQGRSTQEEVHELAARKFAELRGWPTKLASGGLPNGAWAHCFID